jgi:hypothetical protein
VEPVSVDDLDPTASYGNFVHRYPPARECGRWPSPRLHDPSSPRRCRDRTICRFATECQGLTSSTAWAHVSSNAKCLFCDLLGCKPETLLSTVYEIMHNPPEVAADPGSASWGQSALPAPAAWAGAVGAIYLYLTGVGSACNRLDPQERSLARIEEMKGASSQVVRKTESRRSRRSSCQTTDSRIAPRSRCLHPPGACGSSDCRELAQPSAADGSLRLGLALPRRTPVAQRVQRTLQDLGRRAPCRNRQ